MTQDQKELQFVGDFLIDRGFRYPEDFNERTAVDVAAKWIINNLDLGRTKTRWKASK